MLKKKKCQKEIYSTGINESTDTSDRPQVLVFVSYITNNIIEQLLEQNQNIILRKKFQNRS